MPKFIIVLIYIFISSCSYLAVPLDPSNSKDEFDCSHRCASVGMNGVYRGGQCGCEKKLN